MTTLQERLLLHDFVCHEFGYDDMGTMLERYAMSPDNSTEVKVSTVGRFT